MRKDYPRSWPCNQPPVPAPQYPPWVASLASDPCARARTEPPVAALRAPRAESRATARVRSNSPEQRQAGWLAGKLRRSTVLSSSFSRSSSSSQARLPLFCRRSRHIPRRPEQTPRLRVSPSLQARPCALARKMRALGDLHGGGSGGRVWMFRNAQAPTGGPGDRDQALDLPIWAKSAAGVPGELTARIQNPSAQRFPRLRAKAAFLGIESRVGGNVGCVDVRTTALEIGDSFPTPGAAPPFWRSCRTGEKESAPGASTAGEVLWNLGNCGALPGIYLLVYWLRKRIKKKFEALEPSQTWRKRKPQIPQRHTPRARALQKVLI